MGTMEISEETKTKKSHNLLWILISITLGAVLIAALVIQPWNLPVNAQDILTQAYSEMADVRSFRASYSNVSSGYEAVHTDIEFLSPDCYHAACTRVYFETELIVIDGKKYTRGDTTPVNEIVQSVDYTIARLDETYEARLVDTLDKLEKRNSQVIEGEDCAHYYGKSDTEKLEVVDITGSVISYDEIIRIMSDFRKSIYEYEFWISKTDGRIRQIKSDYLGWNYTGSPPTTITVISGSSVLIQAPPPTSFVFTFYDFNQPFEIKPPLDSNGQLLPGWEIVE
jgi:hypothetical protein